MNDERMKIWLAAAQKTHDEDILERMGIDIHELDRVAAISALAILDKSTSVSFGFGLALNMFEDDIMTGRVLKDIHTL